MTKPIFHRWLLFPATLCLLLAACDNSIKISQIQGASGGTMKGLQDATAAQLFTPNEELSTLVQSDLDKDLKIISHLDKDNVLFAGLSGKSVVLNLGSRTFKEVKGQPSGMASGDWSVALGDNQYWALQGGKLYYRNTVGSESAEISDTMAG